jgi:serine/threonine protein kinase
MSDFFNWLSKNSIAATTLIVSFSVIITSITVIYLVAFIQGREISFWPPKIGPKPEKSKTREVGNNISKGSQSSQNNPIIQKDTVLTGVSGKNYLIMSNFYSGAASTLFIANCSNNEVMVKLYWHGLMPNSRQWEFFSREYKTTELLTHRNIVKILDRGLSGGYPFIIMEYMTGGTLRDLLQSRDRIPGTDIISIASQLADAIDFAHSHGIVHRDIKPGNILFESNAQGRVALSDFGIAKVLGAVERDITAQPGGFVGSPAYLAPEALTGANITKASDIYSFGVVLFEMIAGKVPFNELSEVYAVLRAKVEHDPPSIKSYRPVANELAVRIAQTMNREPSERPQTARAVLSGIENYITRL